MNEQTEIDFDAHYSVDGYRGIAFYLRGWVEVDEPDTEWTGVRFVDYDRVRAVMVGDDREHEVWIDDLTKIDEEDYCAECGQLGCTHDGRS